MRRRQNRIWAHALALGGAMFLIDNCTAHGNMPLRHYGRAEPVSGEALLMGPTPFMKLRAIYPHFVRQQTDASCSLASVTTLLNAARVHAGRVPLTQDQVLNTDLSGVWKKNTADHSGDGVDLDAMALHIMQAFHAHISKRVNVDVRRMGKSPQDYKDALVEALQSFEAQPANDYVVINALQSKLFADGEPIGHMSVVGAFDARRRRVLILDVDNRNPMPYWISIDTLIAAMNTSDDMTGEQRGYIIIRR